MGNVRYSVKATGNWLIKGCTFEVEKRDNKPSQPKDIQDNSRDENSGTGFQWGKDYQTKINKGKEASYVNNHFMPLAPARLIVKPLYYILRKDY